LAGNVVPPLPSTGLFTGFPYAGTSTVPIWLFLDVPQWPVTLDSNGEVTYDEETQQALDDIFEQLGIDQDRLACLSFGDENPNDDKIDECSILFDEETQQYIIPTSAECDTIIEDDYDDVNSDYDYMKESTDGLDQGEGLEEDTSYFGELTFTVFTPVVKAENNPVFLGDSQQSLFTTGR